jgi:hypothetical protein
MVRKAFSPFVHRQEGDPTLIVSARELGFFADTMHESSLPDSLIKLQELSYDELKILESILSSIYSNSEYFFTRCISINSILRHLLQYRYFKDNLPKVSSVMEIGPGSGYLSLLIAKLSPETSVIAMDVTQSLYIYQSWLWLQFDSLVETVGKDPSFVPKLVAGKILHLPWWRFLEISNRQFEIDCLVINHTICELHPYALEKILTFSNRSGTKYLFIEGIGLQKHFSNFAQIEEKLAEYGFGRIKTVGEQCFVYSREKTNVSVARNAAQNQGVLRETLRNFPFVQPTVRELKKLLNFLPLSKGESKPMVFYVDEITAFQQMDNLLTQITGKGIKRHFRDNYDYLTNTQGRMLNTHLKQDFYLD